MPPPRVCVSVYCGYRTECEHQENLQDTVVTLMKDTNEALLKNLELQVRTQFLQEDIDTTKERNMKNLSEIQSYMNVLKQVHPATSNDYPMPASSEAAVQDGPTEGHYMDKVQSYNEQIDDLRKKTEEAALSLEQCASECHQVVMYQHSLEDELERYKRFVSDDDYRLQSTVSEEETSVLGAGSPYECEQDAPEGKGVKSKDVLSSDAGEEERVPGKYSEVNVRNGTEEDKEEGDGVWDVGLDDVPDGAQISRVYDALCNMVRERMKKHRRPEVPAAAFYTKGHQVLVTGEASYTDPFFCALVPARSQVIVTFDDQQHPGPMDYRPQPDPAEPPDYNGGNGEGESGQDSDGDKDKDKDKAEDKKPDDNKSDANREPKKPPISPPAPLPAPPPSAPEPPQPADNKPIPSGPSVPNLDPGGSDDLGSKLPASHKEHKTCEQQNRLMATSHPASSDDRPLKEPKYKYYEKIEMIEAVETFTDNKLQGYEETSTIVETTVEKTKQDMKEKI
ncbi:filensin isoform X2 [Leucoraja erinacea]|uniref:filensin isoform X2 n=1 Tax=Leucoraja erinaceus TaxID=7782 RepID=UPI0024584E3E|nr:filensin isoform X2 [Leucoraja erinacea]